MTLKPSSIPLLGLLTWRPMSGYAIKQAIEQSLGNFWRESFGQLYPHLHQLHAEGLIELLPKDDSYDRRKKTYAITKTGRDALADWLDISPKERPARDELLLKVFFATEGNAEIIRTHCQDKLTQTNARLETYGAIEAQLNQEDAPSDLIRQWRLTLRFGQLQARATAQWCAEAIETLKSSEGETSQ